MKTSPESELNSIPGSYTRERFLWMQYAAKKIGNIVVREYDHTDIHELALYVDLEWEANQRLHNAGIGDTVLKTPSEITEKAERNVAEGKILVSIEYPKTKDLKGFWRKTFSIFRQPPWIND